jgi:hypothetical protein
MHSVVGGLLQECTNVVYRQLGRLSAQALGASKIVESVFIHRSVAAGEASFGQSDIDMLVVVRHPVSECCDGPELASLGAKVRRMHAILPVLGQMEVHDPVGLGNWLDSDPYRASQERRSAILVYGKPVDFSSPPVGIEHAARRSVTPLGNYLVTAVRRRNRRNLRKFALDVWNACATAANLVFQPHLTRRETEAHCRACEDEAFASELFRDPDRTLSFLFRTLQRLHEQLLPPLKRLRHPLVFRIRAAPAFQERTIVVLPNAEYALPPEALDATTFLCTPEALDLYIQYTNAFLYWTIPPELLSLGISQPGAAAFVRYCRYFGDTHRTRSPIFMKLNDTRPVIGSLATMRHALKHLCRGQVPPPMGDKDLKEVLAKPLDCSRYYTSVFPRLYREAERLWEELQQLPEFSGPARIAPLSP